MTVSDTAALQRRFDELLGGLNNPMFIVTTTDGERRAGCLVGFAAQCSITPSRFMVWLSKNNHTYTVARRAGTLAVHLPTRYTFALAALFGTQTGFEVDKFARCSWHAGPAGVPLLDDCPAWFAGEVLSRHDTGDHLGLLLRPVAAGDPPGRGQQLGFQDVRHLQPGNEA